MQIMRSAAYVLGALVAVIYLFNPGAGIVELLPDNLPLIGNIDEAAMVAMLLSCLRGLRRAREARLEAATVTGKP